MNSTNTLVLRAWPGPERKTARTINLLHVVSLIGRGCGLSGCPFFRERNATEHKLQNCATHRVYRPRAPQRGRVGVRFRSGVGIVWADVEG